MSLPATATQRLLREAPALCDAIRAIHQRGWCDGTGGNFSAVLCQEPLAVLMAPSGVDKGSLQTADLIVVDGEGQVICGEGKASAETLLHLTIIQTTGAGAVLHTHSQAATLLSQGPWANGCQELSSVHHPRAADLHPPFPSPQTHGPALQTLEIQQRIPAQHPESARVHPPAALQPLEPCPEEGQTPTPPTLLGHLRLVGLEMLKGLEGIGSHTSVIAIPIFSNSQNMGQLSRAALPHLANAPFGVLIAGHGLYAWGDSLPQARRHLEILEFLLEQHWRQTLLNALLKTETIHQ
jgi:methylthioribulose-1-phosphate dehydratase